MTNMMQQDDWADYGDWAEQVWTDEAEDEMDEYENEWYSMAEDAAMEMHLFGDC